MSIEAVKPESLYDEPADLQPRSEARLRVETLVVAGLVCIAYYLGAKIGLALTFQPNPISTLWPPNSILLAALALTPPRAWWLLLLAAFPAHLAAELQSDVPTIQVLAWFVSNCSEALIGAGLVRWFVRGPLRFDSLRHVGIFVTFGALLAPFLSSFLDVAFVTAIGWGQGGYWHLWRIRSLSNVLAALTLVPVIVSWATTGYAAIRRAPIRRHFEAALLGLGLLTISVVVFLKSEHGLSTDPALLYAPMPFLLWAAVRLGPLGTSTSLAIMVFLAIWGAIHGQGPFVTTSAAESAMMMQLFLIVVALPLLFLAAVIEERGQTEAKLRRSEEQFADTFRLSPDAMVITRRADGRIIDVNDRWQVLFGYARSEAVGRTMLELGIVLKAGDLRGFTEVLGALGYVRDVELNMHARSGAIVQTVVAAEAAAMGGEQCHISIIRDVTEQRRIEREAQEQRQEMTHLTRVAVLGQLSGALAHELNQPLTAILSNAQAAQRFLARESVDLDEVREILGDIVNEDKRAGEVIRRLRALLKRGETQFHPVTVNEVVSEALELARGDLVARNVTVNTRLAPTLPTVRGDRVQLQQVLLNLIVNASEAMNEIKLEDRRLTIATELDGGGEIRISVADGGPGIPAERLETLFQPFFTTKEHGLGLGLPISRSIVTAHGGRLWAESKADGGATFCVTLPNGEQLS